ncbi:hypothetical protein [Ancylobacter defluvii]|uniref:Uncharacterized protein n=1 Tax=Ancylobacter defluvii TaxID=1282440 RepID=A0A9W6JZA1_9HYPH|nr:hypothetical protein [Ancylobacter defluvii]MBS7588259.1 hypothetical protein [Ancylobacter defluvii]GLK86656.1 hypothetical protein GCM10017653_47260 [Ancylobacter defluvii]
MATNITNAGNKLDTKIVEQFLKDYERHEGEIRSIKAENAKRCREVQERQKKIVELAKGAGMTAKAFLTEVKNRADLARIERRKAELEDNDKDSFEAIQAALGQLADTPLGAAAMTGNVTKINKPKPSAPAH